MRWIPFRSVSSYFTNHFRAGDKPLVNLTSWLSLFAERRTSMKMQSRGQFQTSQRKLRICSRYRGMRNALKSAGLIQSGKSGECQNETTRARICPKIGQLMRRWVIDREMRPRAKAVVVPAERIELPTFGLQNRCSTAELSRLACQAAWPGASGHVYGKWPSKQRGYSSTA